MEALYSFESLRKYERNPCVIWKEAKFQERVHFYLEIVEAAEKLVSLFGELNVKKHSRILVNIGHNVALLPVVLGILNASCCYCPVNVKEDQMQECLDRYQVCHVVTEAPISIPRKSELKIDVLGTECFIYKFGVDERLYDLKSDILCYSIQTSGSTGQPQIVNVPYSCILPNIISLSQIFSIRSNDVIFVSSPPTFDPFLVDVFIAFMNGAALVFVPLALRLVPDVLVSLIFRSEKYNATVCQMTPSLFRRFDLPLLKEYVFHQASSLRILALGGEPFPSHIESQEWPIWKMAKSHTKIYNIYGITEVSCWSSIAEKNTGESDTPLGESLDEETCLVVRSLELPHNTITEGIGELYIESTKRKCFLDKEDPIVVHSDKPLRRKTGDIVEIKGKKIYHKSRTDAIVKRFGCKINLKTIAEKIMLETSVSDACCVFDSKNSILIAFLITDTEKAIPTSSRLLNRFDKAETPDDFVFLKKFPLSCHGKISKSKLLDYYWCLRTNKKEENHDSVKYVLAEKLKEYLGNFQGVDIPGKSDEPPDKYPRKQSWDELSFLDAGGNSFIALRLVSELEEITYQSFSYLFVQLLDQTKSIKRVLQELEEVTKFRTNVIVSTMTPTWQDNIQMNVAWKYNLEKCVDASPTIVETIDRKIVAVGSHSHKLVCLDIHNGLEISKFKLPDRIESQVNVDEPYGVVGCYDGVLYKFFLKSGEIVDEYISNGMIKSRPLLIDGHIIFGNYSESDNVYCLDFKTFSKVWSMKLGNKSCFASPIILNATEIVVCSLDGIVAYLDYKTGVLNWKFLLGSSIFSTPARLSDITICVVDVVGNVHCIENRKKVCTYELNAGVFSSLLALDSNTFICGCYDYKMYCFEYMNDCKKLTIKWNVQLDSAVYSTPSLIQLEGDSYLAACTTKTKLYIINMKKSSVAASLQLGGEIFSSPAVYDNKICVGCRDNYLYCIEVEKNKDKEPSSAVF